MVNVKANSQTRGHRNIKLLLSKDAPNVMSPHTRTFENYTFVKPKTHVKVPEFLK